MWWGGVDTCAVGWGDGGGGGGEEVSSRELEG